MITNVRRVIPWLTPVLLKRVAWVAGALLALAGLLWGSWAGLQWLRPAKCRGDFWNFNWGCDRYPTTATRALSAFTQLMGPVGAVLALAVTLALVAVLTWACIKVGLGLMGAILWLSRPRVPTWVKRSRIRLSRRDRREERLARLWLS